MSRAVKLQYLLAGAREKFGRAAPPQCPSCSSDQSEKVIGKYFVTELRRCSSCRLMYRVPSTSTAAGATFYDQHYSQGFTTDLPDDRRLSELRRTRFQGTEKDYSTYIAVLDALGFGPGTRLFDFGCSWGYGTWQLEQFGFVTEGLEISPQRAEYARRQLGLSVVVEPPPARPVYDVFFSAHVLEHVSSVAAVLGYGLACLRPGGIFVAFTPNGSEARRQSDGERWQRAWGMVHPNFLDDIYYRSSWGQRPHCIASDPYDLGLLRSWAGTRGDRITGDLSGTELLFACA